MTVNATVNRSCNISYITHVLAQHHLSERFGPPIAAAWKKCWHREPLLYGFAVLSAALALLLTLIITTRHVRTLMRAPISMQRAYYTRIAIVPAVLGFLGMVALIDPRAFVLSELLKLQYEAYAIAALGQVFLLLLSKEASSNGHPGGHRILEVLAEQGPRKHFATPPICCLLAPFMKAHDLTARNLLCIHRLIGQFTVVAPLLAIIGLWAALSLPLEDFELIHPFFEKGMKASSMFALYGLIVLNFSTDKLLKHWHTHKKFVAFKILLLIEIIQDLIIRSLLRPISEENSCLFWAGDEGKPSSTVSRFWCCYLLVIESVPVSLLMRVAFPAAEVIDFRHLNEGVQNVELHLELLKLNEIEHGSPQTMDGDDDWSEQGTPLTQQSPRTPLE